MIKKTKNSIIVVAIFIISFSSTLLFAYKPSSWYYCKRFQKNLFYAIQTLSEKENRSITPVLPGEEFNILYKELIEKKYLNKSSDYDSKYCSYGITIISGKPKVYCSKHGNTENCEKFSSLSANSYYAFNLKPSVFVFIGCVVLGTVIGLIKLIFASIIIEAKSKPIK